MNSVFFNQDVDWIFLNKVDPKTLQNCAQTCKEVHSFIYCSNFLHSYAKNHSHHLTPNLFRRCLLHFTEDQVIHLDMTLWDRHFVQLISEDEDNYVNVRIVKLLASLEWYQNIVSLHRTKFKKSTALKFSNVAFKQCKSYIHLLFLGYSKFFSMNQADKIVNLEKWNNFRWIDKAPFQRMLTRQFFQATQHVEEVICMDYQRLKSCKALLVDKIIKNIFSQQTIHTFLPKSKPNQFFLQPDCFFVNFLESFTHPPQYKSLNIFVINDSQLQCLLKWLIRYQCEIENLLVHIGVSNVSRPCLDSFRLDMSNTKVVNLLVRGETIV